MVHDVWRFEYREATLPGQEPSAVEPVPKQRKTSDNPFREYLKRNRYTAPEAGHDGLAPGEDEYLHWITHCESGDGSINDPLAYWHEKRFKYPNLSRMALDFLTIQPMSAECERLFSAAGRMVNPLRYQLEAQIIGMCQVLRSWLRAGIIHELDPFFISVDEEKVDLELAQINSLKDGQQSGSLRWWAFKTRWEPVGDKWIEWSGFQPWAQGSFADSVSGKFWPCAQWPFTAAETYDGGFDQINTKNPILLVNGKLDPVTPLSGAWDVSSRFNGSRLLVHEGAGRYFETDEFPKLGMVCKADRNSFEQAISDADAKVFREMPGEE
uniref:HAT C-terminal dimerisation domain-containing protein n=1 Tax=Fusarium oxysporum (strain Fo5176) TaxID=660025 RepID=A0A0D2YIF5_FUSOF